MKKKTYLCNSKLEMGNMDNNLSLKNLAFGGPNTFLKQGLSQNRVKYVDFLYCFSYISVKISRRG